MPSPYFYIIQHVPSGKLYAGVKYSADADHKNLLTPSGYHTSSNIVHDLIKKDGLSSFAITEIKLFNSPDEAHSFETNYLRLNSAATSTLYLNQHENNQNKSFGTESYKEVCMLRYGVEHPIQNEHIQRKQKNTMLNRYGVEHACQSPELLEKRKQQHRELHGVDFPMQSVDTQEKSKKTMMQKYGVPHVHLVPEVNEKKKLANTKKADRKIVQEIRIAWSKLRALGSQSRIKELRILTTGWYQLADDILIIKLAQINDILTEGKIPSIQQMAQR